MLRIAKLTIEIFKPKIDTRFSHTEIVSHDLNSIPSVSVACAADILQINDDVKVVGIDEAQFFDLELPMVCTTLANRGVRVIIAGLDMDYKGNPFEPMPAIMAIAESITKVHAVCVKCGNPALYSYRLVSDDATILLGEKENYEPRCRVCYGLA